MSNRIEMSLPAPTSLTRAATRCHLAVTSCATTRELYGYFAPVLDEVPTLRRVALLYRGSGRYTLTQPERDIALEIVRERFEQVHGL